MTKGWRVGAVAAAALVSVGCRASEPMPDFDPTPSVALLLTPEIPPHPVPPGFPPGPDSGLYATLVTTGTPARSPYLRAERFEMRRVSDGARFAWRFFDATPEAVGAFGPALGNYFLPRAATDAGLGWDSIVPGAVYELTVEAGAFRLVGRTRVPGPVQFVREPADGDTIIRWLRAPAAAGYTFRGSVLPTQWIADTAVLIRRPPALPDFEDFLGVFALDSNYAAFRSDFRASSAGISGGWGVFGAYTWAEIRFPPPAGSAMLP